MWKPAKRWCRQREPANPVIRIRRLDVKRVCAYSATIISWFCHDFFPFFSWLYFAIFRKNLLVQLSVIFVKILLCSYWIVSWHLLRGEIKKIVGLRARFSPPHSSCQLELVAPPPKQPQTLTSKPARRIYNNYSPQCRWLVVGGYLPRPRSHRHWGE